MSSDPPRFPMPQGKAPTAIPATERDEDTDETPRSLVSRVLTGLATVSVEQAGRWFLLAVAVTGWALPGAYVWSHMQWGWGPCPHRTMVEVLTALGVAPSAVEAPAPQPAPQPGQRPPIIAPGRVP